jgi:hypothetical protein
MGKYMVSKINSKLKSMIYIAVLSSFVLALPLLARADGMEEHPPGVKSTKKTTAPANVTKPKPAAAPTTKQGQPKKPAAGNTKPLNDYELGKYQYCGRAEDCIVAVNGCCDCANGGIEVAVNKARFDDLLKRFDCLYVQCSHKPADPPCANGVVSCIDHKCQYFDDARRQ